ncbi:hypothetical protein [Streptomyces sp. TP-A0356]|uniref:hypothetical protein n=1 Tax=Streptomyces sp. TP-A0356 TaxID=1359208 RepID=UPI000A71529A|nr:hypothetical protein [Streptomyces sp. TP-A0356]
MTNKTTAVSAERSVSLVLEAEVMMDADTGMLSLVASTDHHMADFGEVCPARLRRMVAEARAKLDEFERLADEYEAIDTLRAILAEHDLSLIEAPLDKLADVNDDLADRLACWVMETPGGHGYVIVPQEQGPIERLQTVSAFIAGRERAA